ncbi:multi-sensor signal transduction histidine kinase [Candidatus Magnetobacterium bavaricum]|uniref:histidine kinase n=1 Tax=Candidatus Magnetobacterium bavaricum TaxID=29290 RepID=A0A0F3GWQ4_9BACT|nr:multi-sensor signal transduction histidine kinase [Candidatus Magnetobacterium bavaricum]
MNGYKVKRRYWLIVVLAIVVLVVTSISGMLLYQTAVKVQSQRLSAAAEFSARLVEVNIEQRLRKTERRDWQTLSIIEKEVIEEINQIHQKSQQNSGQIGEFVWGRWEGKEIVFLLPVHHSQKKSIPLDSDLAEPMRLAIKGQRGVVIGLDYRGEKVLAAYEPLRIIGRDYGFVTKLDMSVVRVPFIRVGLVTFFLAIAAILLGAFAFLRITDPMLRRMQESESRFRCLVEQSLVGICIIQNGKFTYVNPRFAEIFGYDKTEELLGRTPAELACADDREMVSENIRKRISGEVSFAHYCFCGVKKDGKTVQIEVHGSRMEIQNVPAIIGVLLDITRRTEDGRRLQQLKVAEEASRTKNEFLSLVTHELRTPLNGITGFAQTLMDAHSDGWLMQQKGMLGDILEKILQSAFHMASLIEGLLEFSRIEAGQLSIQYEAIDLRQPLDIVKSNLSEKLREKELEFKVQIPVDLPLIHAGLKQLTQVLFNLIGNAIKFIDRKGIVTVRAMEEGAMVLVIVQDSGPGMDEETLRHVFEMFWRGNKAKSVEGVGLGLAITKKIVETMDGEIWVKSELGVGSTFYFTLKQWRKNAENY